LVLHRDRHRTTSGMNTNSTIAEPRSTDELTALGHRPATPPRLATCTDWSS